MDSDSNPLSHRDRDNVLLLIPNPSDRKLHTTAADPAVRLKLGKRTYFDRSSSHSTSKSKSSHHYGGAPSARCQVEGCGMDLSTAKDYHRKHRVCVNHSKSAKVVVAGEERRFCQQCSRFHGLSEFDEKKRSCRRRLSDHNARRRKPQPDVISFGPSRFYDLPRMNLNWNRAPSDHVRPNASFAWEELCDSKLTQTRDSWIKSTKVGDIDTKLHCSSNLLSTNVSPLLHDLDRLMPFKGTTAEVLNQGLEPSAVASDLDGAPDLRCALSLLSNDYWGLAEPHPQCLVNNSLDMCDGGATQLALPLESAISGKQHQVQQPHVLPFDLYRDGGQTFGAAYFHSSLI